MAERLKERIRADLNESRRQQDRARTTVLTMTLSEVRNREIELGRDAADDDVIAVITKAIKQRRESVDQMRSAGRPELADKEEAEAAVLEQYMPAAMSEDEVRRIARAAIEAGATDIGSVMSALMPRIRGRFDGRDANRIVREELA